MFLFYNLKITQVIKIYLEILLNDTIYKIRKLIYEHKFFL